MTGAREGESIKAQAAPAARRWSFASAVLDERSLELLVGNQPVELEPKPLEVLLHLLRHAGEVVTKDELLEAVWPGRVLSDSAITSCVKKLREALRDDEQNLIKTVHGYGYRLVAPVRAEDLSGVPLSGPAPAVPPTGTQAGPAWDTRSRVRLALAAATIVLAIVMGGTLMFWRGAPASASVAVLPFSNLSEDLTTSEHIVGGVHESILTHLAQIKDLKVISRTSVMEYRYKERNLREIGAALGVAHLLEGSVQRVGNRVRVTAQLIEVSSDRHLWAETYERELPDIFAIQSDVAVQVAESVQARLTADEKSAIEHRPTANSEAYDFYMHARELDRRDAGSRDNLFRSQQLLERAIALDPGFALAHAALGRTHMLVSWLAYDSDAGRREKAKASAEMALRLKPGLVEGHLALGFYYYAGLRDNERAIAEYNIALRGRPNSAEIHRSIGNARRRQGRWDESTASLSKALELDPRNVNEIRNLAYLYLGTRRYPEAATLFDRAVAVAPEEIINKLLRAWFLSEWKGELEPLKQTLQEAPAGVDPDNMVSYAHFSLALAEQQFADAARILREYPVHWMPASGGTGRNPKELALAQVHELMGEADVARDYYRRARDLMNTEVERRPESAGDHAALGLAYAGLGEHDQARSAAKRALALTVASGDVVTRGSISIQLALVYLQCGDTQESLDELERSLRLPFGPSAHRLRLYAPLKPLHGHPRFQKMIKENMPGA